MASIPPSGVLTTTPALAESWFDVRFSPTGGWWIAEEFQDRGEAERACPELVGLAPEDGDPRRIVPRLLLAEQDMDVEQRAALLSFRQEQKERLERERATQTELRRLTEEIERLRH